LHLFEYLEGVVEEVKFHGKGCAISIAAASLVSDKVKGMKEEDVKKITNDELLKMLQIPIGPVRIKCALLPLDTVKNYKKVEK